MGALIFLVVVGGIVALIVSSSKASSKQRQQAYAAAQAHFEEIAKDPMVPVTVPELGLANGEVAYYASEAEVFGTHTRTRRVGYSGGAILQDRKERILARQQLHIDTRS